MLSDRIALPAGGSWRPTGFGRAFPATQPAGPGVLPAPEVAIPLTVALRLLPQTRNNALFSKLLRFGRGRAGVSREPCECWVIRDALGDIAAGAFVRFVQAGHPPVVDVATDPRRRREGWATRLYEGLQAAGIDIEGASRASLAHGFMTPHGYAFMVGRRRRSDPDAEASIVAEAAICPACGQVELARRLRARDGSASA